MAVLPTLTCAWLLPSWPCALALGVPFPWNVLPGLVHPLSCSALPDGLYAVPPSVLSPFGHNQGLRKRTGSTEPGGRRGGQLTGQDPKQVVLC